MVRNSRPVWLTVIAPLVVVSGASALASSAYGQSLIIPDATLGNEPSQVVNTPAINDLPSELVTGGAQRGPNLFHSFLEFNIAEGRQVYFANPADIDNIFSRITGSNPSEIFGTLGVDGAANLFLLNPNGLAFGPNARLDIEGSFLASTAEAITFEEGGEFSAVVPQTAPLLTVSVPFGLQYGASSTGATIANEGNLSVGQDLTLAADQLNLQGQLWAGGDLTLMGTDMLQIRDASDSPFVAASRGNLLVQGNEQVDIFALNHPDSGLLSGGNLVLRSANPVAGNAHYWSGSSFRIEQLDESLGQLSSPYGSIVRSLGDVEFDTYEGASLHILAGGAIDIGTAVITGSATEDMGIRFLRETLLLSDGTEVLVNGSAQPTLDFRAGMLPEAVGTLGVKGFNFLELDAADFELFSNTETLATSANITVNNVLIDSSDGFVLITNQYEPNVNLPGGTILITPEDIFSAYIEVGRFNEKGGVIFIDSRSNISAINAFINTSSIDNVGDIVLIAQDAIVFDTVEGDLSGAFTDVEFDGEGSGGDIRITAANLEVKNGAILSASSYGSGNTGSVIIRVSETARFDGYDIFGSPSSILNNILFGNESTAGGGIYIQASNVEVVNGAFMTSSVMFSLGSSGGIVIEAAETVRLDGLSDISRRSTALISTVQPSGQGISGDIRISASNLEITNGAILEASIYGTGRAGDIILEIMETARFDGFNVFNDVPTWAFSGVEVGGQGVGGDVLITAENLEVFNGARIQTSLFGAGKSGNVIVNATETIHLDGFTRNSGRPSGLFSDVQVFFDQEGNEFRGQGTAGDVRLSATNLDVTNGAQLSSTIFAVGEAGNITVNVGETARFDGFNSSNANPSGAFSRIEGTGQGSGGDVRILARNLEVMNGAELDASTYGIGNAGNVIIEVAETAYFNSVNSMTGFPSRAFSVVGLDAIGQGGNINLTSTSLNITDGAQVSAGSFGFGDAGDVIIQVTDAALFEGSLSGVYSSIESSGEGSGGDIYITAENLEVKNNAQLSAGVFGIGDAGNVIIHVADTTRFDGLFSGAFSSVESGGQGSGGDVRLTTTKLDLINGASLSVASASSGNAGDIVLNIRESLIASDGTIGANAEIASGGRILINSGTIQLFGNSDIRTFVNIGTGRGGDIDVNANSILAFGDSDILAFTQDGQGGNITLDTRAFFGENYQLSSEGIAPLDLDGNGRVDINASGAISGVVTIPDVSFIENSLTSLPDTVVDTDQLIAGSCIARTDTGGSFIVSGRGGLPDRPSDTFTAPYATGSVRPLPEADVERAWQPGDSIVEPEGLFQLPDGRVVISQRCEAE